MSDDIVIRILLLPFSLLYGLLVGIRNLTYRIGVLKSVRFNLPVISVGNLSVGGTGKTPHIEYLLRWLDQYISVAVLSRGYGRKTTGYRPVSVVDTWSNRVTNHSSSSENFQTFPSASAKAAPLACRSWSNATPKPSAFCSITRFSTSP